jgi:hypothetical protein
VPDITDHTGEIGGLRRAPAWTITAVLGAVYVIVAPPSSDLAAAAYRSNLFSRVGFTLWDNAWYGGHHLPAYSVLAPALGAWIGPQLLAALSMTAATALFALLIEGFFPARATRIAAVWLAVGASVGLLANRVPFDLGLAVGLAALLAAQRDRRVRALLLTLLCSLASPVAGAFLALAFLAWALGLPRPAGAASPGEEASPGARRWAATFRGRRFPAWLALAALAPIALLTLAFPEGGSQPFDASAFYPALGGVLVIAMLIPSEQRVLRTGALLYAAVLVGSYLIPTAVGSNADRLGALVAGPVAALVLVGRPATARLARLPLMLAAAPFLLYWQANAPVSDFAAAASDPAVHASYYAPLLDELRTLGIGYSARPARIEVVPINDHWEARWVAPHVMIARGWERQLDQYRDALFYDESTPLTPARYRAWLSEEAVSYVALPDATLDYSATSEARLLRGTDANGGGAGVGVGGGQPPAYLREVWRSAHWRLFAVRGTRPLAEPPATLTQLGSDSFTLATPRPGRYVTRVRFTPYWALSRGHGCVREAPGGWTELEARRAGGLHVVIDFSLERVFDHGARCRR